MSEKLYSAGKAVVCAVGGLLALEAVSICGQALATDVGRMADRVQGILAKPEPVKPGLFGRKRGK